MYHLGGVMSHAKEGSGLLLGKGHVTYVKGVRYHNRLMQIAGLTRLILFACQQLLKLGL